MDYSFRQFIEQNYMDQLIAAADSFIQSDNRCDIDVTVKYLRLFSLAQGGDFDVVAKPPSNRQLPAVRRPNN